MLTMTLKEWAAAYRRANEWEQQERIAKLPYESVEDSVRSYFALCGLTLAWSQQAEESAGLWERRMRDYVLLAERWKRLARARRHVAQS